MEDKRNGNYLRLIPRLCLKFKMAAGDVISIRAYIMVYIPTGIKRELVKFGMNCDWKG
jgi:hypothetical protein